MTDKKLPKELLAQLKNKSRNSKKSSETHMVMSVFGDKTYKDIDTVLIALYHKDGKVRDRTKLIGKINSLKRSGKLKSKPNCRGIYRKAV